MWVSEGDDERFRVHIPVALSSEHTESSEFTHAMLCYIVEERNLPTHHLAPDMVSYCWIAGFPASPSSVWCGNVGQLQILLPFALQMAHQSEFKILSLLPSTVLSRTSFLGFYFAVQNHHMMEVIMFFS